MLFLASNLINNFEVTFQDLVAVLILSNHNIPFLIKLLLQRQFVFIELNLSLQPELLTALRLEGNLSSQQMQFVSMLQFLPL